ncbi:hypothetical protein Tco_0466348 [Tanacetum coccineum]
MRCTRSRRRTLSFFSNDDPSTPLKSVASILKGFINDLPFEENDDLFDLECKTNDWKGILYDAPIDEAECFDSGGNKDEIDLSSYQNSRILKDIMTRKETNEPENEPLITFSPKSDPLHHEFTGELIMIPPRIVREHEDYINRMSLLCGTDIAKISRKRSKPDKHGHGKGKENTRAGRMLSKNASSFYQQDKIKGQGKLRARRSFQVIKVHDAEFKRHKRFP